MAWTKDPKVRDLQPYCQKHGFKGVVVVAFPGDGKGNIEVITYGQDAKLCAATEKVGDRTFQKFENAEIPVPDELY